MNKKIFIFLISLFSFIAIDNLKAEEYSYDISDDLIPVFENYTFNTWSTASESSNYNQFKTQIDNVLNKKTSIECVNEIVDNYSNYIFIYGNGNNKAIFWNGNDYEARFGGGYGSYWSMGKQVNGTKIGLYNSISTGNEKVIYLPSDGNYVCSNEYYWSDKQATNTTSLLSYTGQGSNVPNDIITNYNDGYFPTVYTNQDIKVGNYYDGKTTGDFGVSVSYVYDSFTLNGKTYNVDDVIIPRNDTVIPKITFSVSENKETINGEEIVTSKDITVNFSIIDNENYRYLISFDRENWSTITIDDGNSMTFNINDNKTVYVQVKKANDYSMVTSATYLIDGIEEPSLKLKSTFTSELYPGLSKVSVEFNEDIVYKGKINFKLQYGSYEINKNYIPTIKSYKIYAKDLYSDSHWTEISEDSNIYISDIKKNTDFNSSIAESIYTFSLNIPDDICIYQTYRIEIHFENTNNNYYIYTFDNLSSSKWLAYEDIFDNYIYYEFPKDKEYALISHENIVENKSMIYVPYNDIINEKSLFRAYIYDYKSKITTTKLQYNLVESNNYYAYYNFDFSFDRNEMLMLQRKKDTDETVGFYVPNGYIVQFLDDLNDSMSIKTPNGFVDINSGDIDNVFDESATATDYLRIAKKFLNNISDYIKSFFEIIVYFFNKLPAEMYTAIITIFIVFVMCAIIYNIKK